MTEVLSEPLDLETIVLIVNPVSTQAKDTPRVIKDIRDSNVVKQVITIETVAGGAEANRDNLLRAIGDGEGVAIGVCGGDGTVHDIVEIIRQGASLTSFESEDKLTPLQKVPVVPLFGGHMNDFGHMVNHPHHRVWPHDIFKSGIKAPVYPLECTLTTERNAPRDLIAIAYAGVGLTGHTARNVNRYRKHPLRAISAGRVALDGLAGLRAVRLDGREGFRASIDGREAHLDELLIANGTRMSGFKLRDSVWDRGMTVTEIPHGTLHIGRAVSQLLRPSGLAGVQRTEQLDVTFHSPTCGQFDGESHLITVNSKAKFAVAKQPLYTVTTKPQI